MAEVDIDGVKIWYDVHGEGTEHLLQIGAATLESFLEFRSDLSGCSGLLQCGRALLICQLGKGHGFLRLITIIVSCLGRILWPAPTTVPRQPDEM